MRTIATLAFHLILVVSFQFSPATSEVLAETRVGSIPSGGGGYYCPKCGKYHANPTGASRSSVVQTSYTPPGPYTGHQPASSYSGGGSRNVLSMLNGQRARQGIPGLMFDPQLQAVAERRAQRMASTGLKSHPPGSFSPGRYEGVGWSSSISPSGVSACYTSDPRMRYAGAAMATGRDGVYFAVVYR